MKFLLALSWILVPITTCTPTSHGTIIQAEPSRPSPSSSSSNSDGNFIDSIEKFLGMTKSGEADILTSATVFRSQATLTPMARNVPNSHENIPVTFSTFKPLGDATISASSTPTTSTDMTSMSMAEGSPGENQRPSHYSAGVIAGSAIGSIVIIGALGLFLLRHSRKVQDVEKQTPASLPPPPKLDSIQARKSVHSNILQSSTQFTESISRQSKLTEFDRQSKLTEFDRQSVMSTSTTQLRQPQPSVLSIDNPIVISGNPNMYSLLSVGSIKQQPQGNLASNLASIPESPVDNSTVNYSTPPSGDARVSALDPRSTQYDSMMRDTALFSESFLAGMENFSSGSRSPR